MTLNSPFEISARLLPAIRVSDAFISIEYAGATPDGRQRFRYYGTPKVRVKKVAIRYLRSTGFDSQFGHTFIHTFSGPEGERLVWKTGTELSYDAGQGIVATFTVKEHSTYRDNLQTLITRVVDETPALAQAA